MKVSRVGFHNFMIQLWGIVTSRFSSYSNPREMNLLDQLEAEAIYILREAAAQFRNPVLLFSGGKDSLTLLRLAQKAFSPEPFPYSVLHIDTGHNFPETL